MSRFPIPSSKPTAPRSSKSLKRERAAEKEAARIAAENEALGIDPDAASPESAPKAADVPVDPWAKR